MSHHIKDLVAFRRAQFVSSEVDPLDSTSYSPKFDLSILGGENSVRRYQFARRFIPPHAVIADFGCASGYGSRVLEGTYSSYVGLDLPEVVERVACIGRYTNGRTRFVGIDLNNSQINLQPEVDFAIAMEIIEHLFDPVKFLFNLRHTLKPGGGLLLSTPNGSSNNPRYVAHYREYSREEVGYLLREAGLMISKEYAMGIPFGLLLRFFAKHGIHMKRDSVENRRSGISKFVDRSPHLRTLYNQIVPYTLFGPMGTTILVVAHKS